MKYRKGVAMKDWIDGDLAIKLGYIEIIQSKVLFFTRPPLETACYYAKTDIIDHYTNGGHIMTEECLIAAVRSKDTNTIISVTSHEIYSMKAIRIAISLHLTNVAIYLLAFDSQTKATYVCESCVETMSQCDVACRLSTMRAAIHCDDLEVFQTMLTIGWKTHTETIIEVVKYGGVRIFTKMINDLPPTGNTFHMMAALIIRGGHSVMLHELLKVYPLFAKNTDFIYENLWSHASSIVKILTLYGFPINRVLVFKAIYLNDLLLLKLIPTTTIPFDAMEYAILYGRTDIVKYLDNLHKKGRKRALMHTCNYRRNKDIVRYFTKEGMYDEDIALSMIYDLNTDVIELIYNTNKRLPSKSLVMLLEDNEFMEDEYEYNAFQKILSVIMKSGITPTDQQQAQIDELNARFDV
jgi:hypothetical protein